MQKSKKWVIFDPTFNPLNPHYGSPSYMLERECLKTRKEQCQIRLDVLRGLGIDSSTLTLDL